MKSKIINKEIPIATCTKDTCANCQQQTTIYTDHGLLCWKCIEANRIAELTISCNLKRGLCNDSRICRVCFHRSIYSLEKSLGWSKKNSNHPWKISKWSPDLFYRDCICGHELYVGANAGCKYCGSKELCDLVSCQYCYDKSFSSHEKSKYWDSDLNGETYPRYVLKNSGIQYWLKCEECKHSFLIKIADVTRKDGKSNWCSYCSNPPKLLCDDENCKLCFERSFASHENSKYWYQPLNGDLTPRSEFKYSRREVWFNCEDCGHIFEQKLGEISRKDQPRWCIYCAHLRLCWDYDCNVCYNNSFASHPRSENLDSVKNPGVAPRQLFIYGSQSLYFICSCCNLSFNSLLRNVTANDSWCPHCKYKTEAKVLAWLRTFIPLDKIEPQKKFPWCINPTTGCNYIYDFYLPTYCIIIEVDGAQHFRQVMNWTAPHIMQTNDFYKMKIAIANGITIIRIIQEDIYKDKYD